MNRLQEQQFVSEHAVSWRLVLGSWAVLAAIIAGALLYTWSPLQAWDAKAAPMIPSATEQIDWQWHEAVPRLQHRDDDPDEFFDPSDP